MTDQTACRPGTIAMIPLPVNPHDLAAGLARVPEPADAHVAGHGDHLDIFVPETEKTTTLTIPGDPKMIREALCVAEGATLWNVDERNLYGAREVLSALLKECDRHRPLGPNGKHGDRHTATCGCDDVPERYRVATAAQDGQERPANVPADSGACGGGCEAAGALRRLTEDSVREAIGHAAQDHGTRWFQYGFLGDAVRAVLALVDGGTNENGEN